MTCFKFAAAGAEAQSRVRKNRAKIRVKNLKNLKKVDMVVVMAATVAVAGKPF